MPFRNGTIVPNATKWTEEMIFFLKNNFHSMTNKQLADTLKLKLTVTRNKCRELGLKRMDLEFWTSEMEAYLRANYKTKGDVEIMNYLIQHFPKNKGWKRNAIRKKRNYLGLHRTSKEIEAIVKQNCGKGGASYTIDKNSSSLNLHPSWVVQQIAWRDPELQKELLNYPEIIEAKKNLILLNRSLKKLNSDTKGNN